MIKTRLGIRNQRRTSFSCRKDDLPFPTFMESGSSMLAMATIAHRVRIATHGPEPMELRREDRRQSDGEERDRD